MRFKGVIVDYTGEITTTDELTTREKCIDYLKELEEKGYKIVRHWYLNKEIEVFGEIKYINGTIKISGKLTNL